MTVLRSGRSRLAIACVSALFCVACGSDSAPETTTGTAAGATDVPSVVGLRIPVALNRLGSARLCIGRVRQADTRGAEPVVVAQAPPAGQHVRPGTRVRLAVSGPRSWRAYYWMCTTGRWRLTLRTPQPRGGASG